MAAVKELEASPHVILKCLWCIARVQEGGTRPLTFKFISR